MNECRFMMIGAHPDDMELLCGGLALCLRKQGHKVQFISMTDGSAGHHTMDRNSLAKRRGEEVAAVAGMFDIDYRIMPVPDGGLEPTMEMREMLTRQIRAFAPHVIITHRTVDYHPDHRACGQLVMDCSYMVRVPLFCPESPCLSYAPVILSAWDRFRNPVAFRPDLAVPIDSVVEQKIEGCLCHVSQFYEWLPYINNWESIRNAATVEEKTALLRDYFHTRFSGNAALYPDLVPEGVHYIETFEWNEYGSPLTEELRRVMCGQA